MKDREPCVSRSTTHVELSEKVRVHLDVTEHTGELGIDSVTFNIPSLEATGLLAYAIATRAIQTGLIDEQRMDALYRDWYLANPRPTRKGPSR